METTHAASAHLGALAQVVASHGDQIVAHAGSARRGRFAFTGCGDSLAAAQLAVQADHLALSAGDLAWGDAAIRADAVVALSMSGHTGATVAAARRAAQRGLRVLAVTADPGSPLAEIADQVYALPRVPPTTIAGCGAYIMVGLAVIGLAHPGAIGVAAPLASALESLAAGGALRSRTLPAARPDAISVCSLPGYRSAGDFWSLKLIEATGLAARSVPLEEWGHVDYFVGGQPHLDIVLLGDEGRARAAQLQAAMRAVGHDVCDIDGATDGKEDLPQEVRSLEPSLRSLALGALGALVADAAATLWRRPPFRGGAVDMSAAHIR